MDGLSKDFSPGERKRRGNFIKIFKQRIALGKCDDTIVHLKSHYD